MSVAQIRLDRNVRENPIMCNNIVIIQSARVRSEFIEIVYLNIKIRIVVFIISPLHHKNKYQ